MKRILLAGLLAFACPAGLAQSVPEKHQVSLTIRTFPECAIFCWKPGFIDPQVVGRSNRPLDYPLQPGTNNLMVWCYYGPQMHEKNQLLQPDRDRSLSLTLGNDDLQSSKEYPKPGRPSIFLLQTPDQVGYFIMDTKLWIIAILLLAGALALRRRGLRIRLESQSQAKDLATHVGRYTIGRSLGKGAAGEVFEARNDKGEVCALKLLHANLREEPESEKRFLREVKVCSSLNHPNIVKLLDWGQQNDVLYVVMELLEGESLASLLKNQPRIPAEKFVDLFESIAEATQCLHDQGLVHRDLKPDNIFMRNDGRPCLMDFGIVFSSDLTRATRTGLAVGTPAYMAPEQIQGQAEPASDQYSLGVLAFLCLTGYRPFQANDTVTLIMQQLHTPAPLPTSVDPSLPVAFNSVLMRMLAKNPGERFASVTEAAGALRAALNLSHSDEEVTGLVGL